MAMQPESLEVLDKAQFPAGQARAIVRAIEIEIEGARDTLATKHDVLLLRQDVESVRKDVESVRKEVDSVRKDVDSVRRDVESVRREMHSVREGLEGKIDGARGDLLAEIHISANRSTRQLLAATLTLMSMLVGIFYFLLTRGMH
jgi:FtsZ-binding cell division protein ZapB